jgi:hypothetical protein
LTTKIGCATLRLLLLILTTLRRLCLPVIVLLVWAPAAYAWSWPVHGSVLEPFNYDQVHPYAAGQHRGIDIGAGTTGETVVAPAAGTVEFAGTVPTSGESVTIATPDGYSVTLTHLGSILVSKGAAVAEGDAVGTIGPSGTPEVDAPYVHLGIRVTADPNGYVDPLGLLPAPTSESPPTQTAPPPAQPTANGGSAATTTPAAPPAPAPSTSAPTETAETAATPTEQSSRARVSRHERVRVQERRADVRPQQSPRRPALPTEKADAGAPHHAAKPRRRVNEPTRTSKRPIVEAVHHEPTVLAAGRELPPAVHRARQRDPGVPFSLVLNGTAALVALAAAFAASRRRLRASPVPAAQVLELRRPAFEQRRAA